MTAIILTEDRLYLSWGASHGPFLTRGFPVESGHVIFADEAELIHMAEQMGVDLDNWPCVTSGSWEPRCLPIEAVPITAERRASA